MNIMKPYIDLGKAILANSDNCSDRTGAGTYSTFGHLLSFDTREGAPFLTERNIPLRSVAGELLWFLEGSTDVNILKDDYRCGFWDEWASSETGTIGPMYGKQWRDCNGVDQFSNMIEGAIKSPDSRRLLVDSWMPDVLPDEESAPADNPQNGKMSLPPCHYAYQIRSYKDYETGGRWIDLMFSLRSSDYFLGLPNNIASYHMLQVMIASHLTKRTGITHTARWLKVSLGDVHIYKNHVKACEELFTRSPSKMIPRYVCDETPLYYYLNKNGYYSPIDKGIRRGLLTLTRSGVKDYVPGASIKGARNV